MASKSALTHYQAAARKRRQLAAGLIFIVMPIILFLYSFVFPKQSYLLAGFAILLLTVLPFFMVFERRKPKARELVLIAMLAALVVSSHIVLHIFLPVQIGTALIILCGISLGPEAGFLVGALARFVCNFYMGHGPWTPWQMFCWGILGFLAGLAFHRTPCKQPLSRSFSLVLGPVICLISSFVAAYCSYLLFPGNDTSFWGWRLYLFGAVGLIAGVLVQRNRLSADGLTLVLFTFFTTFIVYGGIMNLCAMVTSAVLPGSNGISWKALQLIYLSGVPYDFYHAFSAALCVFFLGNGMIQKLERIKIKYGIYR